MTDYAAVITFPDNSKTYEAFSKLDTGAGYELREAVLVERDPSGQLKVADSAGTDTGAGFAGGTLIGMLIGVLGGPIGMLLGMTAGMAGGALYDADQLDSGDEAIEQFGKLVPPGANAIVAETSEETTGGLDALIAGFGGTVTRRPLDEVLDELEAQEDAAKAADKAARQAVRDQKKQERKESREERTANLKAKFHKDGDS